MIIHLTLESKNLKDKRKKNEKIISLQIFINVRCPRSSTPATESGVAAAAAAFESVVASPGVALLIVVVIAAVVDPLIYWVRYYLVVES